TTVPCAFSLRSLVSATQAKAQASARSSASPSGARKLAPSMLANCTNVAKLCNFTSPLRKASAQPSYKSALPLELDSHPVLPSCPPSRRSFECSVSHNRTAWPWLLRSTSKGALLYQQPMASACEDSTE